MQKPAPRLVETKRIIPGDAAPLFWPSLRPDHASSWHGHVSFAHWLVAEVRPQVVVELGTHNGISFAAFCNAVCKAGLPTQCYALDTWDGDVPNGYTGEEVYQDILNFTTVFFPRNALLLRCYFDAALARFAAESIDILHIDGNHTYEDVLRDFTTWLPKVSRRGIVLFHDTDVYDSAQFGVWRLWAELISTYPHFRFHHSSGLGVLAVGPDVCPALTELFDLEATPSGDSVRKRFELASVSAQIVGCSLNKRECEKLLGSLAAGRTNIALNCGTLQSSVEPSTTPIAFGGVNGLVTGSYGFHTELEQNPWWIVDLGSEQIADEAIIFNRLDNSCKFRARGLTVYLSSDLCSWRLLHKHTGSAFGGMDGHPLRVPLLGLQARYLKLALEGQRHLHLDQVFVYAPKIP